MRKHKVGTRDDWAAARKALHEREQELGTLDEELSKQRAELPGVPVEKEYVFDTEEGRKTLVELFDGRSQLLIYFALTEEQMATSEMAEMVAEAPEWLHDWAENVGTDLAHGMAEAPGWSVFAREDGIVYHTYSRTAPDRMLVSYYTLLMDQIPAGRDVDFPLRRHDEY
jgi:predicted dithiol-disulfide oxidoreductase (DUF899 family)